MTGDRARDGWKQNLGMIKPDPCMEGSSSWSCREANQKVTRMGFLDLGHTPSFLSPSSGADNTAAVHTQQVAFNRQEQDVFFLPILVVDSGPPSLSSTGTLTIRICGCDSSGAIQSCNATAFVMAASLSPGALIALLVCVLILVGEFTRSHPPLPHWLPSWCPGLPSH